MLIPIAVRDFDEAHAGLDEAAGEQALAAEVRRRCRLSDAVEFFRGLGLAREVHHLRHFLLHPEGEFIALDHALDGGIELVALQASRG